MSTGGSVRRVPPCAERRDLFADDPELSGIEVSAHFDGGSASRLSKPSSKATSSADTLATDVPVEDDGEDEEEAAIETSNEETNADIRSDQLVPAKIFVGNEEDSVWLSEILDPCKYFFGDEEVTKFFGKLVLSGKHPLRTTAEIARDPRAAHQHNAENTLIADAHQLHAGRRMLSFLLRAYGDHDPAMYLDQATPREQLTGLYCGFDDCSKLQRQHLKKDNEHRPLKIKEHVITYLWCSPTCVVRWWNQLRSELQCSRGEFRVMPSGLCMLGKLIHRRERCILRRLLVLVCSTTRSSQLYLAINPGKRSMHKHKQHGIHTTMDLSHVFVSVLSSYQSVLRRTRGASLLL